MNNQEIFDTVAAHLLTQNAKSTSGPGSCAMMVPSARLAV